MKLLLERLTATPLQCRDEVSSAWWAEWCAGSCGYDHEVAKPFVFDFEAHVMGEDVYLEGSFAGAIDLQCSRCLKRYCHPLRDAYRLVLQPAGDQLPIDPEGVEMLEKRGLCLGEDLEAGWYRGLELQLDGFFAEVLALAMPVQPVCREDCPGLCPHCGVERDRESCGCTDPKPESPFAALAALRKGSEGDS